MARLKNKMAEPEILAPDILNEDCRGEEIVAPEKKDVQAGKVFNIEFSKLMCIVAVVVFTLVAIYSIGEYYVLVKMAIENDCSVLPDASLPIAGITGILAAVLSYCLYQGGLKASLNKNKLTIGEDGVIKPIIENIIKNCDDDDNVPKG